MPDQPAVDALEQHHRRALARELTAAAGVPLRDRYGFAASDATVDAILATLWEHGNDDEAEATMLGLNGQGAVEWAEGIDCFPSQEWDCAIVTALRPLVADRQAVADRVAARKAQVTYHA